MSAGLEGVSPAEPAGGVVPGVPVLPPDARVLRAERLATPDVIVDDGWLVIAGERVLAIGDGRPPGPVTEELTGLVAPGFVDVHVHGGGGASFDNGRLDEVETIVTAHRGQGTTTMMASLVTDTAAKLSRTCSSLGAMATTGLIAGVHLEGPWLSAGQAGAHAVALLEQPTGESVDRLMDAARGELRMVTLAPELPGALETIERLVAAGIVVAIGHTDATYEQTRAALGAGATVGTHLFNAMRGVHHREPGPIPAVLESDAYFELIADGMHVHPAVLSMAFRPGRSVLVTDAIAAAIAADGDYMLGQQPVVVRDGKARLAASGTIAGSTITLAGSIRYAVHTAGLPVLEVLQAATATPARMLGLPGVGVLAPGAFADLVVLTEALHVSRVMYRGAWL